MNMKELILSNEDERYISFGLSLPERYANSDYSEDDPWYKIHIVIKKPGIEFEKNLESATRAELQDLADHIDKSHESAFKETRIALMEPDYDFTITQRFGSLHVNVRNADSLDLWLTRENLDDISAYIKEIVK